MDEKMLYTASVDSNSWDNDVRRVKIVANSSSPMEFYDSMVLLDIGDGFSWGTHTETPPLLASHDWERPVGHTESIAIDGNKLIVTGILSLRNDDVEEITSGLERNFPWQASLGFSIDSAREYKAGEEVKLRSGDTYTAEKKLLVADAITIWETSFVLFGADSKTSVLKAKFHNNKGDFKLETENKQEPIVEADALNKVEELRKAECAELDRIQALKDISAKYEAGESLRDAINNGTTPADYELSVLRASFKAHPTETGKIDDNANQDVFACTAVIKAGLQPKNFNAQTIEKAERMQSSDLRDVFEACTGYNPNRDALRDASLWTAQASTYNLNGLLSNASNAILLQAFEDERNEWRDVFNVTAVSDFKTAERYRIGSDLEFKRVPNGGQIEHGHLGDETYKVKADVYARQLELTYQDIVNGDALDIFADLMKRFAWGANRAIQKACWNAFLNPTADAGGNAFFSANHGNLVTGKALNFANLAEATSTFITRKRGFGVDADETLGVRPSLLIVPAELEFTAGMITKATLTSPASNSVTNYNPFASYGWKVVSIPDLSDATYGGAYSDTTWYLGADPKRLAGFEITFLNGQQAPTIRQQDVAIGRLGIAFDGHVDFGVSQQDYRGLLKVTA